MQTISTDIHGHSGYSRHSSHVDLKILTEDIPGATPDMFGCEAHDLEFFARQSGRPWNSTACLPKVLHQEVLNDI